MCWLPLEGSKTSTDLNPGIIIRDVTAQNGGGLQSVRASVVYYFQLNEPGGKSFTMTERLAYEGNGKTFKEAEMEAYKGLKERSIINRENVLQKKYAQVMNYPRDEHILST